jgi:hypothetical protein
MKYRKIILQTQQVASGLPFQADLNKRDSHVILSEMKLVMFFLEDVSVKITEEIA